MATRRTCSLSAEGPPKELEAVLYRAPLIEPRRSNPLAKAVEGCETAVGAAEAQGAPSGKAHQDFCSRLRQAPARLHQSAPRVRQSLGLVDQRDFRADGRGSSIRGRSPADQGSR